MIHLDVSSTQTLVQQIRSGLPPAELETLLRRGDTYARYQRDPVGFGREILGESYTDDVMRLMESVRDYPITVARSANAVGKTHAAARIAVWWYKAFPDSQVFTGAAPPESNLKKLLWGQIGGLVDAHPDLFADDRATALHVERSPMSFLTGVTIPVSGTEAQREAKFSGKHAPYLLFILDEGDAIPDEVYRGIESCMSGGHARLLIMFNPRAESGEAYRMERDGRAAIVTLSAIDHPNVLLGGDFIPGAVTLETTVRRVNEWCRPLVPGEDPGPETYELPDCLVGAVAESQSGEAYPPLQAGHYKITEPAFSYMVLGRYPAQGVNQLISREWVRAARARWDHYVAEHGETPPPGFWAKQGQDVGEFGSDANVSIFRYVDYVERPLAWGGVDVVATANRAAAEYQRRQVSAALVDATGIGAGVAPQMQRLGCSAVAVKVASAPTRSTEMGEFKILRDQLWWECREWLRGDTAMLPPDEMLVEELLVPTYAIEKGQVRIMPKDVMKELLKRSPDRADALCLTFAPGNYAGGLDLS